MGIPLEITVILLFLRIIVKNWKTKRWTNQNIKISILVVVFFFLQLFSLIANWRGYHSYHAIVFVGLAALAVCALLPMGLVIFSEKFNMKDRWIGLGTILFVHLIGLLQMSCPNLVKPLIEPTVGIDGINPGVVNSIMSATTVYGTFCAITLVFSLTGLMLNQYWTCSNYDGLRMFYRVLFKIIAVFSLIGGIFSGSRNFIWSTFIGCLYIFLKKKHIDKKFLLVMLLASLLLLHTAALTNSFLGYKLAKTLPYIEKIKKHQHLSINDFIPRFSNDALSNRLSLWQRGLEIWKKKPLLGYGPGAFRLKSLFPQELNMHNFYLQTLVENGLITFLILLALIFSIFKTAYIDDRIAIVLTAMAALIFDNFLDYSASWTLTLAYTLSWPIREKDLKSQAVFDRETEVKKVSCKELSDSKEGPSC